MNRRRTDRPRHSSNRLPLDNGVAVTDWLKNALVCAPTGVAFIAGLFFGDFLAS
jgi:hypothetical protein